MNAKDTGGRTALMLAAGRGRTDVAKILLDNGADVGAKDEQGRTVFWYAVNSTIVNDALLDILKILAEKGAEGVDEKARGTTTALMLAALQDRTDTVKTLIVRGANVNARAGEGGATALLFAAELNHPEFVEVLLANGADVNARDKRGRTALSVAREKGHTEIVRLLKQAGATE